MKIGDNVIAPEPDEEGYSGYIFGGWMGTIIDEVDDYFLVEDQDGDVFQIEKDRVIPD